MGACQNIPSKVKDESLHLAPPTTKKRGTVPSGLWILEEIAHIWVISTYLPSDSKSH